ncbi:MAG: hypothetical protein EA001_00345 [Oscillatoriales cyanobacterium]|nr:MAG: hypothetical protein EA001_00345 [Oscillatoriales cyanobacterium]
MGMSGQLLRACHQIRLIGVEIIHFPSPTALNKGLKPLVPHDLAALNKGLKPLAAHDLAALNKGLRGCHHFPQLSLKSSISHASMVVTRGLSPLSPAIR